MSCWLKDNWALTEKYWELWLSKLGATINPQKPHKSGHCQWENVHLWYLYMFLFSIISEPSKSTTESMKIWSMFVYQRGRFWFKLLSQHKNFHSGCSARSAEHVWAIPFNHQIQFGLGDLNFGEHNKFSRKEEEEEEAAEPQQQQQKQLSVCFFVCLLACLFVENVVDIVLS